MFKSLTIALAAAAVVATPTLAAAQTAAPAAPAQSGVAPPVAGTPTGEDPSAYILGPGDVIEASMIGRGDWRARVKVQVDGSVQLPLIGRLEVTGKTSLQLADEIKRALLDGGYFANPVITVDIASYASRYATVLGEVGNPGLVPIDRAYKMSEVLARVGGVRDSGADVLSIRREDGTELSLSLFDIATGGTDKDPQVLPGDKIFVPQAATFYIYGQINSPGTHKLERGMTLRQALARSGGLTPSGSEKRVRVYRNGQEIERYELNSPLSSGDVVVVGERFF